MPKKYRLNDKKIIEKCAINGRKSYSQYFIIKALQSDSKKFAIVVSKKVDKRASVRNKLKRQVRYALLKNINLPSNSNYLVIIKNNIQKISYKDLESDLLKNFK